MKGVDCKLPMQEDYKSFLNNGKTQTSSRHNKLLIVAGFLLLIAMLIIIGFTFRSLAEISELRQEVEQLKSSFQTLHEKVTDHFDDPDYTEDQREVLTPNIPDDSEYSDYYDVYYDMSYDDDDKSDDDYNDNDVDPNNINHLLTGEDFTKDAKQATTPPRTKRNIIGYTQDSIPINSEPYEEARRKNMTSKKNHRHQLTTPAPTSSYSYPFYSRLRIQQEMDTHQTTPKRPRRVHQDDKPKLRQVTKKSNFLKSGDSHYAEQNPDVEFTVVNEGRTRHRQRRVELEERGVRTGRMRPLPTVHFNGDTSKYVLGQHDNFDGNGRLRHPQKTFVDWAESSWFRTLGMDRHYSMSDGILTVKESGLYFIYAQIFYFDEHDTNGFRVYKNDDETILQCTTMTHSSERVLKGNTCYTAAAEYLQENDRISVGDLSDSRYSLFEPGKSFFGVIKIGDVKTK